MLLIKLIFRVDKENLPKSPEEIARSYPKPPNCPDLTPSMFQELKECVSLDFK